MFVPLPSPIFTSGGSTSRILHGTYSVMVPPLLPGSHIDRTFQPQTPLTSLLWLILLLDQRSLARRLVTESRPSHVAVVAARPHPRPVRRRARRLEDAADNDAVLKHVVVVAPLPGGARSRGTFENQGHRSSASARRPASVIRMRVTLSGRRRATIGSALAVARPALISSASISLLKPWARKIASVQPSRAVSSSSSARRRSRLGPRVRRCRGARRQNFAAPYECASRRRRSPAHRDPRFRRASFG